MLLVVGRQDTGDLEAQIRGSRYAWDIRIVSVDALLRLMKIKEEVEDPLIVQRIHSILIPREFTRLDEIADVLFSAAEDIKQDEGPFKSKKAGDAWPPRSRRDELTAGASTLGTYCLIAVPLERRFDGRGSTWTTQGPLIDFSTQCRASLAV